MPIGVEAFRPLDLFPRFDPTVKPIYTPGNTKNFVSPQNPLETIKLAVRKIAELVSKSLRVIWLRLMLTETLYLPR